MRSTARVVVTVVVCVVIIGAVWLALSLLGSWQSTDTVIGVVATVVVAGAGWWLDARRKPGAEPTEAPPPPAPSAVNTGNVHIGGNNNAPINTGSIGGNVVNVTNRYDHGPTTR